MAQHEEAVWREFSGLNAAYLDDLYEQAQSQPEAVPPETREFFERWGPPPAPAPAPAGDGVAESPPPSAPARATGSQTTITAEEAALVAGGVSLANAIRTYGHRAADLDPLGGVPAGDASLRAETHGIKEKDLAAVPGSIVGGPAGASSESALHAIRALRRVYQGPLGYEFEHVSNAEERAWLHEAVEACRFQPPNDPIDDLKLLERLTEVGALERFLHTAYQGQTRFSLEGLGMMVPVLDELISQAAEAGTRTTLLGMAHRGRLNVLVHVLGKPYEQLIAEFMGNYEHERAGSNSGPTSTDGAGEEEGWTGDVKYHFGAKKAYRGGTEVEMQVYMAPNPSHLEWVNPVVVGMDRACDERRDAPGTARQDELSSMSILIHGDASFPGQGVVAETLNLSRLPGYRVGGTIHVIANNQIGFTTSPSSARSTIYASDLAKGFEIPVIHVNADRPEACIAAARLAHAYRERFAKDVLIDLIGYRRWGHNEGDEPRFTQPLLYRKIDQHPTVRELWARDLMRRGKVTYEAAQRMLQDAIERLHNVRRALQSDSGNGGEPVRSSSGVEAGGTTGGLGRSGVAAEIGTAVPEESLGALNEEIYTFPPTFHLHPKLEKPFARRRTVFATPAADSEADRRIEWAHAEALAFASILAEKTPIRLTGQDVGRGTFSHRHAVLQDVETGDRYVPLQAIPAARASFEVWDSPLSESATLGFEFGYSVQAPEALVVWEAQYGDFINVPQAIIDQFIVSARTKWGQKTGMVMLLPHGYEGQGPEHSSARLERFLQMAAEDNVRIVNCTTAAQYFHLLRRQARLLDLDPRPLIVMSPKSLLRNPLATSPPEQLTRGGFQPVLEDPSGPPDPKGVQRLVLCSGKVFYDLQTQRTQMTASENGRARILEQIAVVRVEELYPFPEPQLRTVIDQYPNLEEVVWLQEEPRNMGAWTFVAPRLRDLLGNRLPLVYVGRTRRASPSEGSHEWHVREQKRLIEGALQLNPFSVEKPLKREVEHAS